MGAAAAGCRCRVVCALWSWLAGAVAGCFKVLLLERAGCRVLLQGAAVRVRFGLLAVLV